MPQMWLRPFMTAGRMGMLAGRVKGIPLRIERRQDASMSRL